MANPNDGPKRGIPRNGSAFSLIELLTVIIIVTLLAILFIAASRLAVNIGYETACVRNLKTLYQVVLDYRNDNNDAMVPSLIYNSVYNAQSTWIDVIDRSPYITVGPDGYFACRCPADPLTPVMGYAPFKYGMNPFIGGAYYGPNGSLIGGYARWAGIANLSNRVLFMDAGNYLVDCTAAYYPLQAPAFRHNGRANGCFLDGHVEAIPSSTVTLPASFSNNPPGAWPW